MSNHMIDSNMDGKSCVPQETTITHVRLAHAYVPFQKFCTTMTPIKSLMEGTVFPELTDMYMQNWNPQNVKEKKPWTEILF